MTRLTWLNLFVNATMFGASSTFCFFVQPTPDSSYNKYALLNEHEVKTTIYWSRMRLDKTSLVHKGFIT